jgi:hypothetical protein
MQYASFSNGEQGYVLHRMTGQWSGHCSAWYDKDGNLLDAQQVIGTWTRVCRPVKRNGPMWRELATTGRAYAASPQRHTKERMIAAAVAVRSTNA